MRQYIYGIRPHRKQLTPSLSLDKQSEVEAPITTTISENQEDYNSMMKQTRQSSRSKCLKVGDCFVKKIACVTFV